VLPFATALIALVATASVIAACGGSAATTAPSSVLAAPTSAATVAGEPTTSPTALETAAVTAPPVTTPPVTEPPVTAPPPTEPPVTAPPPSLVPGIGVKLQIGDQQFMTVLAAEQWPGAGAVKPKKGKAFFTVSIRIDAITVTSFDSADFKLKDKAGKSYAWRQGRAPHLYSLNNMTPGGTYVGWITYEIPKASLGELTIIYKPAFLGGTSFKIPLF
jgi:hypothetical protein